MGAVIAEISYGRKSAVAHGSCLFLPIVLGRGLPVILEVAHSGSMAMLSVCLESYSKLSRKIADLNILKITPGLEVVTWQKVEPVGGMLGGYLER